MISARALSFFGLIYGGLVLSLYVARQVESAFGGPATFIAIAAGAILTTVSVYYSERWHATRKAQEDQRDIQTRWRDDLYSDH